MVAKHFSSHYSQPNRHTRSSVDRPRSFVRRIPSFVDHTRSFVDPARSFVDHTHSFVDHTRSFVDHTRSFVNPARSFVDHTRSFASHTQGGVVSRTTTGVLQQPSRRLRWVKFLAVMVLSLGLVATQLSPASAQKGYSYQLAPPPVQPLDGKVIPRPLVINRGNELCSAVLIYNQWALTQCKIGRQDLYKSVVTTQLPGSYQSAHIKNAFPFDLATLIHLDAPIIAPLTKLPGTSIVPVSEGSIEVVIPGKPERYSNKGLLVSDHTNWYSMSLPVQPASYCKTYGQNLSDGRFPNDLLCAGTKNIQNVTNAPQYCPALMGHPILFHKHFSHVELAGFTFSRIVKQVPASYAKTCASEPVVFHNIALYVESINRVLAKYSQDDVQWDEKQHRFVPMEVADDLRVTSKPLPVELPVMFGNQIDYYPGKTDADGSDTAIAISQIRSQVENSHANFTRIPTRTVLLANEEHFGDSLAASSIQKHHVLLLNQRQSLEPTVLHELQRLGAREVILLGGHGALSQKVERQLQHHKFVTRRLAGGNREETAAIIHSEFRRHHPPTHKKPWQVYVAKAFGDGSGAFADAIALGALSARTQVPIMLTNSQHLTPYIQTEVKEGLARQQKNHGVTITLIGGTKAISSTVESAVTQQFPDWTVNRYRGSNRFATAVNLAQTGNPFSSIILVDGVADNAWQAGFAVTSLAYVANAPVLLTDGKELPPETKNILKQMAANSERISGVYCFAPKEACDAARAITKN